MQTKLAISIFVIAAMALFGATITYVIDIVPAAQAQEGVPFEKNFGQCKQDKNRNACENNK